MKKSEKNIINYRMIAAQLHDNRQKANIKRCLGIVKRYFFLELYYHMRIEIKEIPFHVSLFLGDFLINLDDEADIDIRQDVY